MSKLSRQAGFAAVAAIFLVVGLAAFGAFMMGTANTQQIGSSQDLMGTRVYWAARAGLEWGIAGASAASACPAASSTLSIDGFTVRVSCVAQSYSEGGGAVTLIQLVSIASFGTVGTVSYIERSVSAGLER